MPLLLGKRQSGSWVCTVQSVSSETDITLCPSGRCYLARSKGTVAMRWTVREIASVCVCVLGEGMGLTPGQSFCVLAQGQTDEHVDNWRMVPECILLLCFCGNFGGECGYLGSECDCLCGERGYLGGECGYLGSV